MPLHIIVGAGVAGLQTARALLRAGLNVLVLERKDDIGGAWSRDMPFSTLQVPAEFYTFPEFPWPNEIEKDEYPTGRQVRAYIQAYAKRFGLYEHIRFRCQLAQLQRTGSGGWDVVYLDHSSGTFHKRSAQHVVICTGMNALPLKPDYDGSEVFRGVQLHSHEFKVEAARGKRVVIVGAGKTALDCVGEVASSKVAASVTWLFRQPQWPMPRVIGGVMPMTNIIFSKLPQKLLPPYYTAPPWKQTLHAATVPLKRLAWAALERTIVKDFGLTGMLQPHGPLAQSLLFGGQILDGCWSRVVSSGAVTPLLGEIDHLTAAGMVLSDGSHLEADLVLYCTGFTKSYDFLEGGIKARLGLQKDGLYLYRNILPPLVPGLAFIGSEVSTFNSVLTAGLQAEWLARVLTMRVALPSVTEQQQDVREQQRWRRAHMPPHRMRGSVYQLYQEQYHRQLMADMGLKRRKRGFSKLPAWMRPLTAEHYRGAFTGCDETPAALMRIIGSHTLGAARPVTLTQSAIAQLAPLDSGSNAGPSPDLPSSSSSCWGYLDVPLKTSVDGLLPRALDIPAVPPLQQVAEQQALQPLTPDMPAPKPRDASASNSIVQHSASVLSPLPTLHPSPGGAATTSTTTGGWSSAWGLLSGKSSTGRRSSTGSSRIKAASSSRGERHSNAGRPSLERGISSELGSSDGRGSSNSSSYATNVEAAPSRRTSRPDDADPLAPVRQLATALMEQAEEEAMQQHMWHQEALHRRNIGRYESTLTNVLQTPNQPSPGPRYGLGSGFATAIVSGANALPVAALAQAGAVDRLAPLKVKEQRAAQQLAEAYASGSHAFAFANSPAAAAAQQRDSAGYFNSLPSTPQRVQPPPRPQQHALQRLASMQSPPLPPPPPLQQQQAIQRLASLQPQPFALRQPSAQPQARLQPQASLQQQPSLPHPALLQPQPSLLQPQPSLQHQLSLQQWGASGSFANKASSPAYSNAAQILAAGQEVANRNQQFRALFHIEHGLGSFGSASNSPASASHNHNLQEPLLLREPLLQPSLRRGPHASPVAGLHAWAGTDAARIAAGDQSNPPPSSVPAPSTLPAAGPSAVSVPPAAAARLLRGSPTKSSTGKSSPGSGSPRRMSGRGLPDQEGHAASDSPLGWVKSSQVDADEDGGRWLPRMQTPYARDVG